MIQNILRYTILFLLLLLLLSFEIVIGMPVLYIYVALQTISNLGGYSRILLTAVLALLLSISIGISVTFMFILFASAVFIHDTIKQKTVLHALSITLLTTVIVIVYGTLELLPLSFVYMFVVSVVLSGSTVIRDRRPQIALKHR